MFIVILIVGLIGVSKCNDVQCIGSQIKQEM